MSSRETLSGGSQSLSFGAMFMAAPHNTFLRQHEAGVGLGVQSDGASGRQVGLAVEQALELGLAAA